MKDIHWLKSLEQVRHFDLSIVARDATLMAMHLSFYLGIIGQWKLEQIGSCWRKMFGKGAGAGGAIAFRKAAVYAVHHNDKNRSDDLAG